GIPLPRLKLAGSIKLASRLTIPPEHTPAMQDCLPVDSPLIRGLHRQAIVQAVLTNTFHGNLRIRQRLVTEALANRLE
ncbi:MAG TPA: hypothetical protein VG122_05735, partial [Gemmata sp.]|nr:hypothetical protein [Gemmata sp.]